MCGNGLASLNLRFDFVESAIWLRSRCGEKSEIFRSRNRAKLKVMNFGLAFSEQWIIAGLSLQSLNFKILIRKNKREEQD